MQKRHHGVCFFPYAGSRCGSDLAACFKQVNLAAYAVCQVGAYFGEQVELAGYLGKLPADSVCETVFFIVGQRQIAVTRLREVVGVGDFLSDDRAAGIRHTGITGRVCFAGRIVGEGIGLVVNISGRIAVCHITVLLMVCHRRKRTVDRKLCEVRTDAVTLGIRIGKSASLKHFIRGKFDAGNDVCGAEGGLLDVCEKVFRVFIDSQHPDFHKRELVLGPDFRVVQRVEGKGSGSSRVHELYAEFVADGSAGSEARVEIADGDIRVQSCFPSRRSIMSRGS